MSQSKRSYRVTAPLIQIQGHVPGMTVASRHLRDGDIVPDWVPATEIERLLDGEWIEVAS